MPWKKFKFEYIHLSKIDVSDLNVRKTKREEGLGELAKSIKEVGVQQPVVVFQDGARYKLVIGQRRYLACKIAKEKEIPALIIQKKSDIDLILASFSENIHRTDLDYRDKMQVAGELLKSLGNVTAVARKLGVSPATVNNYLGYAAVPDEIKKLVSEKKLSATTATRIAQSIPDKKKAIRIAHKVIEKPRAEDRLQFIEIAKENPDKTLVKIEKIHNKTKFQKITLDLTPRILRALEQASKDYKSERETIATLAIEEWLQERGFLGERAG
jgi:ParB family chromosome partitioning protein